MKEMRIYRKNHLWIVEVDGKTITSSDVLFQAFRNMLHNLFPEIVADKTEIVLKMDKKQIKEKIEEGELLII